MAPEGREWELWDRPGVVPRIEKEWSSPGEMAHRENLASLSAKHIRKGDCFLEVGCGSGLMHQALSRFVEVSYTGVDTSKEMLRAARAAFPNADFRDGDGYKMPFPDRSFDAVAAYDVLQHIPDIVGFIREMVRVSRRTVLFTIPESARSTCGRQDILGNSFLVNRYSQSEAEARVKEASGGLPFWTTPVLENQSNFWIIDRAKKASERLVLYTAIFGDKDIYREPPDGDYETVLFTDRPPAKTRRAKVVQVPRVGDPRRLARLYKTTPHLLFPEADLTIWMDGLIEIRQADPRKFCLEHLSNADLAAHFNVECSCVYKAGEICIQRHVDDPSVIGSQMARYRAEGYPEGNGLVETGIVLRRNTPEAARFNETWKDQIERGSVRDQLSFNYAVWKTGVRFSFIPDHLTRTSAGTGFCVGHHSV